MSNLEEEIEALIAIKKRKTRKFTTRPIGQFKEFDEITTVEEKIAIIEKESLPISSSLNDFEQNSNNFNINIVEREIKSQVIDLGHNILNQSSQFVTKSDLLASLSEMSAVHKKWISYVRIFIRLGSINEFVDAIPKNHTSCKFGEWYYGEGQLLASLDEFQKLEQTHQNIHEYYSQIYNLFSKKNIGTLFSSIKKQESTRNKKVNAICEILKVESSIFTANILILENAVENLTDDVIYSLSKAFKNTNL